MKSLSFPLLSAALCAAVSAQTSFTTTNHAAAAPASSAIAVGDLDSDGDPDSLLAHPGSDVVTFNRNVTGGTVWTPGGLFSYAPGSRPVELAIDNLDGSGRRDVAVVLSGTDQVAIHRANGAWPGFLPPQIVAVGSRPIEIVSLDVDQDGDRDLAVLCQSPAQVQILRNAGGGVFAVAGAVPLGVSPHAITVGNFNANGAEDIVVTGSFGMAYAEVLLNQSTTTTIAFTPGQQFVVDYRPFGVCAGDFNGDGFVDIATAGAAFSTTTVLLNDPGSLSTVTVGFNAATYPLAPGVIAGPGTEIECGDFDCDSDNDLAIACNGSSNVAFLWNNGAGVYGAAAVYPSPTGDNDLALADFNDDGWLDVGTSNGTSNDMSILMNNFNAACCRHVFVGGISDAFSNAQPNGPEESCPGPQLLSYYSGPVRNFDGPVQCSEVFMHTFQRLPRNIKSARVRMRLRADCTSPGDVFGMGFSTANNWFCFTDTVGDLTGSPWTAGSTGGVGFDLANLPNGMNLLPKIAAEGRLDFFIRSNTAVDSIQLIIETCAKSPVEMNLSVTPYVTPGTWDWNVSGAPANGFGFIFLGPAVGAGPGVPWGQLCVLQPSLFAGFPTNATGSGTASFTIPVPLGLPCFTISAQSMAWDVGVTTVEFSNTWTQQIFD